MDDELKLVDFGIIVDGLKKGSVITARRKHWPDNNYIQHSKSATIRFFSARDSGFRKLNIANKESNGCVLEDFILIHADQFAIYSPTQQDMLADDWVAEWNL